MPLAKPAGALAAALAALVLSTTPAAAQAGTPTDSSFCVMNHAPFVWEGLMEIYFKRPSDLSLILQPVPFKLDLHEHRCFRFTHHEAYKVKVVWTPYNGGSSEAELSRSQSSTLRMDGTKLRYYTMLLAGAFLE